MQKMRGVLQMKWHSVKEFRPPQHGTCLVRTENGTFYCAEWRGGCSDVPDDNSQYTHGWMMDTLCEEYDSPSYIELYGITHFCIPDAIEIERKPKVQSAPFKGDIPVDKIQRAVDSVKECEHVPDGTFYAEALADDVNYKCKKCGEFYR